MADLSNLTLEEAQELKQLLETKKALSQKRAVTQDPGLIPQELSQIGAGVKEKVTGILPERFQKPAEQAFETAGQVGREALSSFVPGGRTTLEKPEVAGRTAGAILFPGATLGGLAGRGIAALSNVTGRTGEVQERQKRLLPTTIPSLIQREVARRVDPETFKEGVTVGGEALGAIGGQLASAGTALEGTLPDVLKRRQSAKAVALARKTRLGVRKTEAQPLEKRIGERITKEKIIASQEKKAISQATKQRVQKVTDELKTTAKSLEDDLQRVAEKKSLGAQSKIRNNARRASTAFGREQDTVIDDLANRGEGITRAEQFDIAQATIDEANELAIKTGAPRAKVEQILKKMTDSKLKAEDFIEFQDFIDDMRGVQKVVSPGAKTSGFTAEDIVAAIYRKNAGKVIALKASNFATLQREYSSVIETMKKAHRTFNTFKGSFETKRGTELLKRIGRGKVEAGERRFVESLEKGTKRFGKGTGDITKDVKRIGKQVQKAKKAIGVAKQKAQAVGDTKALARTKKLEARVAQLKRRQDKVVTFKKAQKIEAEAKALARQKSIRKKKIIGGAIAAEIGRRTLLKGRKPRIEVVSGSNT